MMAKKILSQILTMTCLFLGCELEANWSLPPLTVTTTTIPINVPTLDVVVDPQGNAIAVWAENDIGTSAIYYATLPFGANAWIISPTPIATSTDPIVDLLSYTKSNSSGDIVVIWGALNSILFSVDYSASVYDASTGQFNLTNPSPIITTNSFSPFDFSVAGNGDTIFSYVTFTDDLYGQRLPAGSLTWDSPIFIGNSPNISQVSVATDGQGNAVVAWLDSVNDIITSYFNSGSNLWLPTSNYPAQLYPGDTSNVHLSIDMSPSGRAVLAWIDDTNVFLPVRAAFFNASSSFFWQATSGLPPVLIGPERTQVKVDGAGNAVVVFNNGIFPTLQGATLANNSSVWTLTGNVSSTPLNGPPFSFDLGINQAGQAAVIWVDASGVIASLLPSGSTSWGASTQLANFIPGPATPLVSIAASPVDIVAVWATRNEPNLIQSSRYIFAPTPPSNLVGRVIKNIFLLQTDRIHRLTWSPSLDPTTIGYHLYRNGQLIATIPVGGPFVYDDHNRSKHQSDTYTLVAFNSSGNESTSISVTLR